MVTRLLLCPRSRGNLGWGGEFLQQDFRDEGQWLFLGRRRILVLGLRHEV